MRTAEVFVSLIASWKNPFLSHPKTPFLSHFWVCVCVCGGGGGGGGRVGGGNQGSEELIMRLGCSGHSACYASAAEV